MNARPTTIDQYLATVPDDARDTLGKVRQAVLKAAPDAVEGMGYGMPSFKYGGRPLVYMAAAKNHCALYGPAIVAFEEELAGYDTSKGTLRFPPDKPPPQTLIRKLVKARIAEIDAAEERRSKARAAKRRR